MASARFDQSVLLHALGSILFAWTDLDGVYPGGPGWFTGKYNNLAEIAYVFAVLIRRVAYLVARGSEAASSRASDSPHSFSLSGH